MNYGWYWIILVVILTGLSWSLINRRWKDDNAKGFKSSSKKMGGRINWF